MRHFDTSHLDFKLPQVCIAPQLAPRVPSGAVTMLALPMTPQPVFVPAAFADGLANIDDQVKLAFVRQQYFCGNLREVQPVSWGHAFALVSGLAGEKVERVGTAIVLGLNITRLDSLAAGEIGACGYGSREEFVADWERYIPEAPALLNPWVWLVRFEYKGVTPQ